MAETNAWLGIPDAFSATIMARAGFDSVTLDIQHGLFDVASVANALMALDGVIARRYVRPPVNEAAIVGKILDMGADGLIVPMVNTQADAARLAAACCYPPRGERSFGPMLAALRMGAEPYSPVTTTAEVFAMIETREALAACAEIAGVDGISGLFIGPNDLGLALGHGAGSDREEAPMLDALAEIVAAARRAGKRAGIFCRAGAYAARMAAMGFDLVTVASDSGALAAGAATALAQYRA